MSLNPSSGVVSSDPCKTFSLYYRPLAKDWMLFDNSGAIPSVIASESDEKVRIMDESTYSALVKRYGHP